MSALSPVLVEPTGGFVPPRDRLLNIRSERDPEEAGRRNSRLASSSLSESSPFKEDELNGAREAERWLDSP